MCTPMSLYVYTGDGRTRTDGGYRLAGEVNGMPFWKKDEDDRWLYSSTKGLWTITDDVKHFETGWGYVVSSRNNGEMPNMMKRWKGAIGDQWQPLPKMVVSDSTSVAKEEPCMDPEALVSIAIAEEEAAANQDMCSPQRHITDTMMLLNSFPSQLAEIQNRTISEKAATASLQLQRDHIEKLVESKNARLQNLEDALLQEKNRAAQAEISRTPLLEQSQHWRQAAQELDTVKLQMEGELQEVKNLATHRLREKDRAILNLQNQTEDAKATVSEVTRQLEAAREEVKHARENEKKKEDRMKALEEKLKDVKLHLHNQERLVSQKEYRRSELEEVHMQNVVSTVSNDVWEALPLLPLHSADIFHLELDDELPPSPVSRKGWPSQDAVVASLADIIRKQRLC